MVVSARSLGGVVAFALVAMAAAPRGATLAQTAAAGRVVTFTLHAPSLEGNAIHDRTDREITVYLPPAYDRDATRRYPVLYLLHGTTSHPSEWLDGTYQGLDLGKAMDAVVAAAPASAFLVVMPAADNAYGGTFFVNSAAFGRWEDFVVQDLVAAVDARFRTRPDRANRGLAGQSMGGFGALSIAGRHPDRFGFVYATSPCCLGLVGEIAPDAQVWANVTAAREAADRSRFSSEVRRVLAMSMAFGVDERRLDDWRAWLPLDTARRDASPYARLCGLALDYGRQDEIPSVPAGTDAFAAALARAGVPHRLDKFEGGHVDRLRGRFERHLLPFFSAAFSGGAPCRP